MGRKIELKIKTGRSPARPSGPGLGDLEGQESRSPGPRAQGTLREVESAAVTGAQGPEKSRLLKMVANKGRPFVLPCLVNVKTHKAKRRSCLTGRFMDES